VGINSRLCDGSASCHDTAAFRTGGIDLAGCRRKCGAKARPNFIITVLGLPRALWNLGEIIRRRESEWSIRA